MKQFVLWQREWWQDGSGIAFVIGECSSHGLNEYEYLLDVLSDLPSQAAKCDLFRRTMVRAWSQSVCGMNKKVIFDLLQTVCRRRTIYVSK